MGLLPLPKNPTTALGLRRRLSALRSCCHNEMKTPGHSSGGRMVLCCFIGARRGVWRCRPTHRHVPASLSKFTSHAPISASNATEPLNHFTSFDNSLPHRSRLLAAIHRCQSTKSTTDSCTRTSTP